MSQGTTPQPRPSLPDPRNRVVIAVVVAISTVLVVAVVALVVVLSAGQDSDEDTDQVAGDAATTSTLRDRVGSAPQDADPRDFCSTYYDETGSAAGVAERLAVIGTPAAFDEVSRRGFEAYVVGLADQGDVRNKDVVEVRIDDDDRDAGIAFVSAAADGCTTSSAPVP